MDTQTEQTAAPTEQKQGTHHFILTVQKPDHGGINFNTFHGTLSVPAGATRQDTYDWIRAEHDRQNPHLTSGVVVFFALEPNGL